MAIELQHIGIRIGMRCGTMREQRTEAETDGSRYVYVVHTGNTYLPMNAVHPKGRKTHRVQRSRVSVTRRG